MTFKQRRKALGYSVKAIAKKLGYSHRTVEAWDGGRKYPDSVGILLGYIEALTNIQAITNNNYDHDMLRIAKLAKGAMENPR